jgi:hypothetical protein
MILESQGVFQQAAKEYQAMMDPYMMGTGGGDGDEANFSNWWEHDDTCTGTYLHGRNSKLYFSLMYMWDKLYNFVFVARKDPLPGHMAIGDIYYGDEEELCFSEGEEDALSSFSHHSSMTTPKPKRSPGFEKNSDDVAELMSTMRDMAAARNSANETQKQILTLLNIHDQRSSNQAEFGRGGITMNDIEQTQRVIHNFEADLGTHKAKKQKLVNIGEDKNDNRIQKLNKAIKSTKSMIKIS